MANLRQGQPPSPTGEPGRPGETGRRSSKLDRRPHLDTPARAGPGLPRDTAQKSENLSTRRHGSLGQKSQRKTHPPARCSMSDASLRDPTDKRVDRDPYPKGRCCWRLGRQGGSGRPATGRDDRPPPPCQAGHPLPEKEEAKPPEAKRPLRVPVGRRRRFFAEEWWAGAKTFPPRKPGGLGQKSQRKTLPPGPMLNV